jgi:Fic family protein
MAPRGRPSRTAIHERLEVEVRELRERLGGLPRPTEAEGIWQDIWYHEAHNSTALEGNTLVLRQVERLLSEGRAVGNKELREYLEVWGYADAARWVYDQGAGAADYPGEALLTVTEVRRAHSLAMSPVWEVEPHPLAYPGEGPGSWRQHDIRPFPAGMMPPEHTEVPALVHDWVVSVCRVREDPSPIAEAIARRHAAFERIHPFLDGNGRAGRLLMNLVLVRLGYPPAVIQKRERDQYLKALCRADAGDCGPLGEIVARAILENLMRFVLPAVAGPARLVPLEALTSSEVSHQALTMAARRGTLRAVRADDGNWRSTRRWVDEYLSQRYTALRRPRGPRARAARPDVSADGV